MLKRLVSAALPLLFLAACGGESAAPSASVANAWVRLPAAPGGAAAGYFEARIGGSDDAIVEVTSPSAQRIEMHETRTENGIATMARIQRAGPEGGQPVTFEPGGRHLMIYGLDPQVREGGAIELNLRFERAPAVRVSAQVRAANATEGHGGH